MAWTPFDASKARNAAEASTKMQSSVSRTTEDKGGGVVVGERLVSPELLDGSGGGGRWREARRRSSRT